MKDVIQGKASIAGGVSLKDTQQARSLLKILALGNQQIDAGKTIPAGEAIRRLRGKAAQKTKT